MRFGRDSDLSVGNVQYKISTYLESSEGEDAGQGPSIETRITRQGRTVFLTATSIPELRPVFQHSQEIGRRIEILHETVREQLKAGQITLEEQSGAFDVTIADPTVFAPPPAGTESKPESVSNAPPEPVSRPAAKQPDRHGENPIERPDPRPSARKEAPSHRRTMGRSRAARRSSPARKTLLLVAGGAILALGAIAAVSFILLGGESLPVEALDEASSLLSSGQHARAIEAYSRILTDHSELAPALIGRGRARIASGSLEEGLVDLARAVELDPETPATAEELADVLSMSGRHEEAQDYYQRAIAAGSTSAEARFRLASSLVALDRAHEALPHLEASLSIDADNQETRFLYGKLLNIDGRYADAERELRAVDTVIDGDYFFQLGFSLLKQGKLDEAEEAARRFLDYDSQDARSHALLGEVYLSRKQLEPARSELILALKINPEEPRAQIALGRTWLAIGQRRGDRGDLAKARQVLVGAVGVPEGERLLVLGQVSLAGGNTDEALSLLERSLENGAEPLSARLSLAAANITAGDLAGAAGDLQHAEGLAPSDPAIALSLGIVYFRLKDMRRAAEELLKAIQGIGLAAPADEEAGPVVLPTPHVPLPPRFDINQTIRTAYRQVLRENEDEPTATALKNLAESTSFVIGGGE